MKHNFKTTPFNGTLWDLIASCKDWLPSKQKLLEGQNWVLETWNNTDNILPVRKFAPYSKRGEIIRVGNRQFVTVDNEPFTAFYKMLLEGSPLLPFNQMFGTRLMPAS